MKKYIKSSSELDPRFNFSFDEIEPEFWLKTTTEPARIYLEDERVIGNGAGMEYDIVIAIPRSEDHWQMESDIQENLDRHVREILDGTDYYGNAIVTETNAYPDFANIPDDVFENSVFYKAIIEIVPYDNIGPYGDYGIDFGVEDIESSKKINCDEEVVEEISEEVVNDPNAVRTYQNRRNENKFIETKKYKDGHSVARQYMKWETPEGTVKNYSGAKDAKRGRWHRAGKHSQELMLEDYDEVIKSSTSIKCSTVIDFAEHKVTKDDVSSSDWEQLQHTVNFDYYDSLQQMAQDLVNVIEDDQIFSEVEWNIFHAWYDENGFTKDDWDYVKSCGYERDQF